MSKVTNNGHLSKILLKIDGFFLNQRHSKYCKQTFKTIQYCKWVKKIHHEFEHTLKHDNGHNKYLIDGHLLYWMRI